MLFLTLQDPTDLLEVVVMPDSYAAALPALATGGAVIARGQVEVADHGGAVLRATRLRSLRLSGEFASAVTQDPLPDPIRLSVS
jgi:hypothetical protein